MTTMPTKFGPDPYYPNDLNKQARLNAAIIRGYIKKTKVPLGFVYELTLVGASIWKFEKTVADSVKGYRS